MWSLGVILYILLSGLPPFWGDTEVCRGRAVSFTFLIEHLVTSILIQEQIFKMVLRGHIDFKTDPWPKLSDAAKDCVKRLLEQVRYKDHRVECLGVLSSETLCDLRRC